MYRIKKLIKILLIIGVGLALFINCWAMLTTHFTYNNENSYMRMLQSELVINAALGVPYYNILPGIINDSSEKVDLSTQEWMNFQCISARYKPNPRIYANSELFQHNISNDEKRHIDCLRVKYNWEYGDDNSKKSARGELCSNDFNCQIINFVVNDYILDHPHILKNLLNILERPCDYIKTPDKGRDRDEESATYRGVFGCHKNDSWFIKERIFIILSIVSNSLRNPDNLVLGEFIVRRKDI